HSWRTSSTAQGGRTPWRAVRDPWAARSCAAALNILAGVVVGQCTQRASPSWHCWCTEPARPQAAYDLIRNQPDQPASAAESVPRRGSCPPARRPDAGRRVFTETAGFQRLRVV